MRKRFNRPALVAVVGVFALLAVVAVASSGSTPSGSGDTRPPSEALLDTFFSLGVFALIPGALILVYGLMQRKAIAEEIASGRYRRADVVALVTLAFFVGLAIYFGDAERRFILREGDTTIFEFGGANGEPTTPGGDAGTGRLYIAEFTWIPVAIVLALIGLAVGAYALASRRRAETVGRDEAEAVEELAEVLDETLDDLRADPDARRAVIAAYARLERAFASAGLARRRQETAEEYVPRALAALEVDTQAVRRLTDLFTVAKFSHHPVSDEMKLEAVSALERIRDDLRAAAARAAEAVVTPELRPASEKPPVTT